MSESNADQPPVWSVTLWPHRSLSPKGFRVFLAIIAAFLFIPLLSVVGTGAFWIIGAFLLADILLVYGMMKLTYRSGKLREVVRLWPDRLLVERFEPSGRRKAWEANPHWVRVSVMRTKTVEDYLVLSAGGKDIELGAFLTPEERRSLADELRAQLSRV